MKALGISAVIFSMVIAGCQATGPTKYHAPSTNNSATISSGCAYDSIEGKSFRLNESFKPYVTNHFFFDPDKVRVRQLDKNHYEALRTQNFKVIETGVVTVEDIKSKQPYLSMYRYFEEEIGGNLYKRDKSFSTKVLTEDCTTYYLHGGTSIESLRYSIIASDGSKISDNDVLWLIGDKPLEKLTLKASIEFDRFEKMYKIATPFYNDRLIRGSVNANNHSVSYIQLYIDLIFFDKWGFINNAVDTDGKYHEVTKISMDTDCSNFDIVGCILTETVGISLYREFLEKHSDGFEIKVFGTKEKIVKVPGIMVKSFLSGLESAIYQSKKGANGVYRDRTPHH